MRTRVGFLKVPQWRSDEAAFETTFRSISSSVVGRWNPTVDRRAVGLSSLGRRCRLVTPSAALRQLLFNFSYLSFP